MAVFTGTVDVTGVCAVVTVLAEGSSTHPAVIRTAITRRRGKYCLIVFLIHSG
jgi:hypothetical protein